MVNLRHPKMFNSILLMFIVSSFFGQAFSVGKIYLSHLALIPVLFIGFRERVYILQQLKKSFLFPLVIFLGWCALTLLWNHSAGSIKYFVILCFGFIQYLAFFLLTPDTRKFALKILLGLVLLEVGIALGEVFGWWRFPISDLNPEVSSWGKKGSFLFDELPEFSRQYVMSSPTGFRWAPNPFIFALMIYLFVAAAKAKKWILHLLIFSAVFLTIAASARIFYWCGFGLLATLFLGKRRYLDAAVTVLSLALISGLLLVTSPVLGQKARECVNFPDSFLMKMLHFDYHVATPAMKRVDVKSEANQVPSETHRYIYLKNAWRVFVSAPLQGSGLGASSLDQQGKAQSPHFFIMEIMADTGVIGVIFYLGFLLLPIWRAWKQKWELTPLASGLTLFFILGTLPVSSLIYFPLYYLTLGWLHGEINDENFKNTKFV